MTSETLRFEHLVQEYSKLPKIMADPTYLELCRYPSNRFEEICTRLLCFYFDPTAEHGYTNLFLDALLEILSPDKEIHYRNNQIQVINELNAEKKRLDMLIKSPDMIIGIENKINASVYNPLETYSRQINLFGKENIFKVVLTLRKITGPGEKQFISDNGFRVVYYSELIAKIKKNIGSYISSGSPKYLTFIYDFIQTLERMTGDIYENNKQAQFFASNSKEIEELITQYNHYNERILKIQKERISELMARIKIITNDHSWWAWEDWDLGISSFHEGTDKPKIGIESSYEFTPNDPLGRFRIYITTWKLKDFSPYEDALRTMFPENHLDKGAQRVYLHMDVIENDDQALILEKLETYYHLLKKLVSEI